MEFLGVDIGISSIKYGRVSLGETTSVSRFVALAIPHSDRLEKYTQALRHLLEDARPYQAAGLGFPSRIWEDHVLRKDTDFDGLWRQVQADLGGRSVPCFAINDADAAGMAEVYRREAEDLRRGVTVLLTLGSGIGSAVFLDGRLLPNTEMGTIEMHGMHAEQYAAPSVKTRDGLSLQAWAARLQEYLEQVEFLLSPHHLVLGGGISADFPDYQGLLKTRASLQPAFYRNQAGVIGAAVYAAYRTDCSDLVRRSGFASPAPGAPSSSP